MLGRLALQVSRVSNFFRSLPNYFFLLLSRLLDQLSNQLVDYVVCSVYTNGMMSCKSQRNSCAME